MEAASYPLLTSDQLREAIEKGHINLTMGTALRLQQKNFMGYIIPPLLILVVLSSLTAPPMTARDVYSCCPLRWFTARLTTELPLVATPYLQTTLKALLWRCKASFCKATEKRKGRADL